MKENNFLKNESGGWSSGRLISIISLLLLIVIIFTALFSMQIPNKEIIIEAIKWLSAIIIICNVKGASEKIVSLVQKKLEEKLK
tara:strand:+ start:732 stop:983 length:252 start_codon:yes stop_codon:yes gene_type:complete